MKVERKKKEPVKREECLYGQLKRCTRVERPMVRELVVDCFRPGVKAHLVNVAECETCVHKKLVAVVAR